MLKSNSVLGAPRDFFLMISARQIKAARALLGLGQLELAKNANLGLATVRRIEAAVDEVTGTAQTMARIQHALEEAGASFIDQDGTNGPGVRLRNPLPKVLSK